MLISRRKEGETLLIGDNIEVRIVSVRGKKVVLGIVAPREIKIAAAKLSPAELSNTAAAVHSANLDNLLRDRAQHGEAPVLLWSRPIETKNLADTVEE
jgi:carbon storage regulator